LKSPVLSLSGKGGPDVAGGITCVVGPNGCGKSNIVDAIRWVMVNSGEDATREKNG